MSAFCGCFKPTISDQYLSTGGIKPKDLRKPRNEMELFMLQKQMVFDTEMTHSSLVTGVGLTFDEISILDSRQ